MSTDNVEQFLNEHRVIRDEFRQESPCYTIGAMATEIHKLRGALTAIKECGSKGQAKRIAIQGLSTTKQDKTKCQNNLNQ